MPLERVPIVHRFGIISHNQRVNLQERLFEKAVEQATARPYDKVRYAYLYIHFIIQIWKQIDEIFLSLCSWRMHQPCALRFEIIHCLIFYLLFQINTNTLNTFIC